MARPKGMKNPYNKDFHPEMCRRLQLGPNKVTAKEIAVKSGYNYQYVSDILRGKLKRGMNTMCTIATICGWKVDELERYIEFRKRQRELYQPGEKKVQYPYVDNRRTYERLEFQADRRTFKRIRFNGRDSLERVREYDARLDRERAAVQGEDNE